MPNKIGSEHLAVIKVVGVGGGGTKRACEESSSSP